MKFLTKHQPTLYFIFTVSSKKKNSKEQCSSLTQGILQTEIFLDECLLQRARERVVENRLELFFLPLVLFSFSFCQFVEGALHGFVVQWFVKRDRDF